MAGEKNKIVITNLPESIFLGLFTGWGDGVGSLPTVT